MTQVEAIYQNGVFKPLQVVALSENQRVRLNFESLQNSDAQAWLTAVKETQDRIIAQRGCFPDSTLDIAEDRRR